MSTPQQPTASDAREPQVRSRPASEQPASSVAARSLFVLGCAAVGALLGILAGWLWNLLADSPEGVVFEGVAYFDEAQLNVKSEMTLWYLAVGVVLGVVAGLVVGLRGYRHGVTTVAAVLALGAAASAVTALTGIHLFGPDEAAQVAAVEEGGEISAGLAVDSWVAYLGWPAGALIGALAAIAGWPHDHGDLAAPPPAPPPSKSSDSANS